MLQVGVVISGGVALLVAPSAWQPVGICVVGALISSLICERAARRYLHRTLGGLRRVADDLGRGRPTATIEAQPGDDFHKLVSAINLVGTRLADASQEEKRLHEQLRRSERMAFLGELAATVAHEVNNPLDGVQNCARILRRSFDNPERAEQMLDLIDSGLGRIDLIVRRLLTLAREHVIRPVESHLNTVIDSAVEVVSTKIEGSGISVVRRLEAADDRASVDPQLLEQVFVNLLLNAIDSMPEGGELTITTRREVAAESTCGEPHGQGAVLCVDVADTGVGIAADVLPHIFEPFYTTKARGRGTGLGLPIAARIVDAHRGAINVGSRDGGGTVFAVRLPALATEAAVDEARTGPEEPSLAVPTPT